jgi:hypothetical protein
MKGESAVIMRGKCYVMRGSYFAEVGAQEEPPRLSEDK